MTALPLAASAKRSFITAPITVSNWLSSGMGGIAAAEPASTLCSTLSSGIWNAGSV